VCQGCSSRNWRRAQPPVPDRGQDRGESSACVGPDTGLSLPSNLTGLPSPAARERTLPSFRRVRCIDKRTVAFSRLTCDENRRTLDTEWIRRFSFRTTSSPCQTHKRPDFWRIAGKSDNMCRFSGRIDTCRGINEQVSCPWQDIPFSPHQTVKPLYHVSANPPRRSHRPPPWIGMEGRR